MTCITGNVVPVRAERLGIMSRCTLITYVVFYYLNVPFFVVEINK
jgi:hypothetical protein